MLTAGSLFFPDSCLARTTPWKIAFLCDTATGKPGGHGLETAFYGLPHIDVVAHIDSNEKGIEKRMETTRAKKHYPSLKAMFEKETPDIVVLTSRLPDQHLDQIREAAEHGSHVYCEKPMAASLEDADKIVEIVRKYNTKVTIAHPRRYDLGYITMKRLIEEGKIGIPLTMEGWSKNDHRGGGEDMLVLGSHIFDLFIFFFGHPQSVCGEVYEKEIPFTDQPLTKTEEPVGLAAGNNIFAAFRFANGVHGIYGSRVNLYKHDYPMGVSVTGSTGMLSLHFSDAHRERQPLRYNSILTAPAKNFVSESIPLKEDRVCPGAKPILESFDDENKIPLGPVFAAARRFAVCDLMEAITDDRQPICNVFDARAALEMIYGIYASHLQKGPVEFPLKDRAHPLAKIQKKS